MFDKYKDIVTVDQLCEMLNISRNLAYRILNNREIKSVRIGRVHRIPKVNVIQYVQKTDQ